MRIIDPTKIPPIVSNMALEAVLAYRNGFLKIPHHWHFRNWTLWSGLRP